MGGDQLVPALVGREVDRAQGDSIRDARAELYRELIAEVASLDGPHELIADLKHRGLRAVLASSSPKDELASTTWSSSTRGSLPTRGRRRTTSRRRRRRRISSLQLSAMRVPGVR
jgi:hypothetical protein